MFFKFFSEVVEAERGRVLIGRKARDLRHVTQKNGGSTGGRWRSRRRREQDESPKEIRTGPPCEKVVIEWNVVKLYSQR